MSLLIVASVTQEVMAILVIGNQTELLKYEIFVKKLGVSYDGGSNWVTVFEGTSSRIDLTQGSNAGTFFVGQNLPVGTVNKVNH